MHFPPLCPEVPVASLAALDYYRDKLGFTIDWSDEQLALPACREATRGSS